MKPEDEIGDVFHPALSICEKCPLGLYTDREAQGLEIQGRPKMKAAPNYPTVRRAVRQDDMLMRSGLSSSV